MIGTDTMADLDGRVEALLLQERSYTARDYLSQHHRAAPSEVSFFPASGSASAQATQREEQVHHIEVDYLAAVVSPSASSVDLLSSPQEELDLPSAGVGRKRRSNEISPQVAQPWTTTSHTTPPQAFAPPAAQLVTDPSDPTSTVAHEIPPSPIQTARTTTSAATTISAASSSSSQRQRAVSPSGVDQFDLHSSVLGGGGRTLAVPTLQDWRSQIAEWFFKVADSLSMSREIVAVAVSYLDRYLGTLDDPTAALSRRQFQLVCLTCLYVATKLYDHKILPPESVVNLSRGCFTSREVEDMERTLLDALSWRLSPPTPLTFVRHLLLLLPRRTVSRPVRRAVSDVAKYLTELSVIDYAFVGRRASAVGLGAVLAAMDAATYGFELSAEDRLAFERAASRLTGLDCRRGEVADCRLRLRAAYRRGGVCNATARSTAGTTASISTSATATAAEAPSKKRRRFHTSEIFVASTTRGAVVY